MIRWCHITEWDGWLPSKTLNLACAGSSPASVAYIDRIKMPLTGDAKREYQRNWIRRRRDQYFKDKSCTRCGSIDNLELDHIDRTTKLYNPAALWGMSDKNPKKIAELAKCQVLCEDCHLEKSSLESSVLNSTISRTMICSEGHDLNLVGYYHDNRNGGFFKRSAVKCRYCNRVYHARRRGHKVPTIEEHIEKYSAEGCRHPILTLNQGHAGSLPAYGATQVIN